MKREVKQPPLSSVSVNRIKQKVASLGTPYVSGSSGKAGYSYLPIPFPEFEQVLHHRPDSYERFEAISRSIALEGRQVLDLGCSTGFFCFKAADMKASIVTGIEYDMKAYGIALELQELYRYPIRLNFLCGLVEDNLHRIRDVVFAMSIAHWVRIRSGDGAMTSFLREIAQRAKVAFIELPTEGSGGAGIPWLKSQDDVYEYLHQCGFSKISKVIEVTSHAGRRTIWMAQRTKITI